MQKFDLDNFLPYQLSVLANRVSQDFSETYRHEFGISIPEWRVLAHLSQADKVSVREIYCKVDMDKSKVSRAAARLEKAGYIRKVTGKVDKRLIELSLTNAGRKMTTEIADIATRFEESVLDQLDGVDIPHFRAAIQKLLQAQT